MEMRIEADSIGSMVIPADAYYGVQSLRAKKNFNITGRPMHPAFIRNLVKIKKAAAMTNQSIHMLEDKTAKAIISACDEIINGKFMDQFIVDSIQGGAGTSVNMNANEVIANRAAELLGGKKGEYSLVHPNDHVNMAQSTNDVIPSAGKLTILELLPQTIYELRRLQVSLTQKAREFDHILKIGRTQLQDAVPMRLGQAFQAYASVIARDIDRMVKSQEGVLELNMGGTAIGSGINAGSAYFTQIVPNINKICKTSCRQSQDLFDATQNLDGFVNVSGVLKTCAVNVSKLCNDLRLLSSGPKAGFAEINLPAKQNGSSIMPGKVNPVIPEVVTQVAFHIIGNDMTITLAAEAGQLELNAFEPVLFYNLFESIETLKGALSTLVDNCIEEISANEERCQELLETSVGIATALCPLIGYQKSAELAKKSLKTGVSLKKLVMKETSLSNEQLKEILNPAVMTQPANYSNIIYSS
ncbi:MAG: aspA [Lachnospiraceae bacterium]|nr:aspA [Lachnospiraceae bacterium]